MGSAGFLDSWCPIPTIQISHETQCSQEKEANLGVIGVPRTTPVKGNSRACTGLSMLVKRPLIKGTNLCVTPKSVFPDLFGGHYESGHILWKRKETYDRVLVWPIGCWTPSYFHINGVSRRTATKVFQLFGPGRTYAKLPSLAAKITRMYVV